MNVWKDAPYHMSSGNYKSNQQWHNTTPLFKWPKSGIQTPKSGRLTPKSGILLGSMGNNRKTHSCLVGMQTITLEDSLAVSYKSKHTLTIQPGNCICWYLPKWIEVNSTQKSAHGAYSSYINNWQALKATKMSFSMRTWTVAQPDNKHHLKLKRNRLLINPWKDMEGC